MKIVITSQKNSIDSAVDSRFGRASFFCVVDTESGDVKFIDNKQNLDSPQGAGIQAGQIVAKQNADYLLTGYCGPKAFATLQAAEIKVIVGVEGPLVSVIDKFKNGEYKETDNANVEGHWV